MDTDVKCESAGYLETVRALHQTVISLRSALEESRSEILELRNKAWPTEHLQSAIGTLSLENHVLRQQIVDSLGTRSGRAETNEKTVCFKDEENGNVFCNTENLQLETTRIPDDVELIPEQILDEKLSQAVETESSNIIEEDVNNIIHGYNRKDLSQEHLASTSKLELVEVDKEEVVYRKDCNVKRKHSSKKISVSINLDICKKSKRKQKKKTKIMEDKNSDQEENLEEEIKDRVDDNLKEVENLEGNDENDGMFQHSLSTDLLNQELDNIELIFTNEDVKETNLKEDLISIDGINDDLGGEHDSGDLSEKELEDDVFNDNFENENQENAKFQSRGESFDTSEPRGENITCQTDITGPIHSLNQMQNVKFHSQMHNQGSLYDSKSDNSLNHEEKSLKSCYSYQDSSFDKSFENKSLDKDESFDRFEERVRIVETDISKVGIHDVEYSFGRRNTCPNPLAYRPIIHREALGKGLNARKTRPILASSNAAKRESGAQTDISALPNKNSWRSESNLAPKIRVGDNFTTLPSKYPHPASKLRLSDKTSVEARRILLSDIGFTSMVPELSRSADHLCPPNLKAPPTAYGQYLRTPEVSPGYASQVGTQFTWTSISPSDSHSHSRYSSQFPLPSPPATAFLSANTHHPSVDPAGVRSAMTSSGARYSYRRGSAPVSPSRFGVTTQSGVHHATTTGRRTGKHIAPGGKLVRFATNGSLPELRSSYGEWYGSSDSTDSLVDEAEQYLRRSIDCILMDRNATEKEIGYYQSTPKPSHRRASAPEPARDNIPPQGWQPFLPRQPRDLKLDNWVKVISAEGRVRGGRIRYIGHLLAETHDQFVGVQLGTPDGTSDGSYNNRRYFQCEPNHGLFVPFKKVIMAWKP